MISGFTARAQLPQRRGDNRSVNIVAGGEVGL
jgi:hypothetical protein